MNFRSLILSVLALVIFTGTASAAKHPRREYRRKQARVSTGHMKYQRGIRSYNPRPGASHGPVKPYSSREYVIRPYHEKKPMRGGGRGTIHVLR